MPGFLKGVFGLRSSPKPTVDPREHRGPTSETELNGYPLVLVHGFLGWGRDELLGLKYWGGDMDLEAHLRAQGFETHTATVGPLSSNWDRACELYACIKGGRVDYGAAHAEKYGHRRFGRSYPGLLPEWGEVYEDGKRRKIHLIAHSMGGQTARQLIELLYQGCDEERRYNYRPGDGPHELFTGGKTDWVNSLSTLASPHDGTTLASALEYFIPFIRTVFVKMARFIHRTGLEGLYDFKMEHWGIERQPGESFNEYLEHVLTHPLSDTQDVSAYDFSPEGARDLNERTSAKANVYYFSWAASATFRRWFSHHHHAAWHILPLLHAPASVIGTSTKACMWRANPVTIDGTWLENDGIVNTRAMAGPTLNSNDQIVEWNGTPRIGKWNFMGTKDRWDHMNMVSGFKLWPFPLSARPSNVCAFYEDLARQLRRLPG